MLRAAPPRHGVAYRTYPVRLVLDLETTFDDGTVQTSQVSGTVAVTVVNSAVSQ